MPARLISHYRIVRRLGAGGMGEVFLAQDTQLERPVALKVMSAELAKDPNQRKRFRTEAKAASGLNHPHICVIHEVGETEDGRPFLAMEYVEGQTLDVVLQERRLKLREALNLGIEVAEALEAAHARGLVHRDIKPANIMLDRRGGAKMLDFGLAKWFAPDELSGAITSVAHTRTGMLIGTPQYMSPEQALGRTLDPRTDIFSLGVVLYELVAGQRPFLGKTVGETINNIVNQAPAPLGLENPVFSPALDNILFKCLEKDPEKRYASAKELAADLRKVKEDSDRALAATTLEQPPTPSTHASGERQPTALWKLAAKAGAGRNAALGWTIGIVVVALLAVGGWVLLHGVKSNPSTPGANLNATAPQKSVAVLPFVNMSSDKENEYLSDGLTEEVLNALAKVKGLRVPARTSSFAFKGKTDDIRKIGEQLSVTTVLEGSVRKAGDKLRITAQLVNVADGFHLWSETYDRDMTNLFTIQSDIASRVAEALKVQLLGAVLKPTTNVEAYTLYLKGRYLWNRRTVEDIRQAIEHFNRAIAEDPACAVAHAGLADCYVVLPSYTGLPYRDAFPKARAAALQALELDSTLAEPHAALAFIKAYFDWNWTESEAGFRRAITLNPNYATAHHWFANVLESLCRNDEALAELKQAQEIDPLSRIINASLGIALHRAGKTDAAMDMLKKQIALDPSFLVAHQHLGIIYLDNRKLPEAIAEFETMRRLDGSGTYGLVELGAGYLLAGRTNDVRTIRNQMLDLQQQGNDQRVGIAKAQRALGDDEAALTSLEKALEERAFGLESLYCDSFWKELRPHPRFQAILRKMNLVK
jgi:serine/threonine-protein kinase